MEMENARAARKRELENKESDPRQERIKGQE
jgi:hypothetical protein